MNLATVNCDAELIRILSLKFIINDEDPNIPVFINWLGENAAEQSDIVFQIEFLEKAVKDKRKILVFDKDLSLQDNHISYLLRKKNVILCEPAINHRREFLWLPYPIETLDDPPLRTQEKKYDVYIPNKHSPSFTILNQIKEENYPEITSSDNYKECKCYLICDILRKSLQGYLEPVNYLLREYCLPLIYKRQRFYHYLFKDLMVYNSADLKWHIDTLQYTDYGLLKEFYERVNSNFPEMRAENWLCWIENALS